MLVIQVLLCVLCSSLNTDTTTVLAYAVSPVESLVGKGQVHVNLAQVMDKRVPDEFEVNHPVIKDFNHIKHSRELDPESTMEGNREVMGDEYDRLINPTGSLPRRYPVYTGPNVVTELNVALPPVVEESTGVIINPNVGSKTASAHPADIEVNRGLTINQNVGPEATQATEQSTDKPVTRRVNQRSAAGLVEKRKALYKPTTTSVPTEAQQIVEPGAEPTATTSPADTSMIVPPTLPAVLAKALRDQGHDLSKLDLAGINPQELMDMAAKVVERELEMILVATKKLIVVEETALTLSFVQALTDAGMVV